jgi:hypothetical protein
MKAIFYNIFDKQNDGFLGTVRVELFVYGGEDPSNYPAPRARRTAAALLDRPESTVQAIMSSEEMYRKHGIN